MVYKLTFTFLFFILLSCESNTESIKTDPTPDENLEFYSEEYSTQKYTDKLNYLIKNFEIDLTNRKYAVVITNERVGKQLRCSTGMFHEKLEHLKASNEAKDYIFISNDSTLFDSSFKVAILKSEVFKNKNIVHPTPYLYEIQDYFLVNGRIF